MTTPSHPPGPASAAGDLFEPESRSFWRDEDLGAMFRHQLAAPLLAEVAEEMRDLRTILSRVRA